MNDALISRAAELYGVTAADLRRMHGGNYNQVYEFELAGKEYILRIAPPDEEFDFAALQSVLAWMAFLAEKGAPVSRVVSSRQGGRVEQLEQDGGLHQVTVFEKIPGILGEELGPADWTPVLYRELGRVTGRLHALAPDYIPLESLRRPQWDEVANNYNPAANVDPELTLIWEKRAAVLDHLRTLPKTPDCYGLIHGDFHGGNFLVNDERTAIHVIDFDDCFYGWYMMDIAMHLFDQTVLYSGSDKSEFAVRLWHELLAGYQLEKPLSAFWAAQLPYFLKLLELGLYVQVYRFYDPEKSDPDSWVGKFMPGRRARIEQDRPCLEIDFNDLCG